MSDEGTPSVIEDLALGAFRLVKEKLAFELDFTPETLPVLDHYVGLLRSEDGGTPDETVLSLVAPCAGAYFGEVVRRSLAGLRWHCPEGDYTAWRLEAEDVFLCFNPIGVALEALHREPLADFHAHYTLLPAEEGVVKAALEATGPVREDDFYRFAVRHEVLEQALGVLRDLARAKGEPARFGPDAYAAVLGDGESTTRA